MNNNDSFQYYIEKFGDTKILRYKLENFSDLSLKQKEYIYYLSEAALCGRDILWDQNGSENLLLRRTMESILTQKDRLDVSEDLWDRFTTFLKRVWFANGIHHHYSMDKFAVPFDKSEWEQLGSAVLSHLTIEETEKLDKLLFDKNYKAKRVSLDTTTDLLSSSANNYYQGVTQVEADKFYEDVAANELEPQPSRGLNTQLIKDDRGNIKERLWHQDGMYGTAIAQITYWLEKAMTVCENSQQEECLALLIAYYKSGDLQTFDQFNIKWVKELSGEVDFINGFIEVYGDALGMKASWESVVQYTDHEASKRTKIISDNAQWFEDHSPTDPAHKKEEVKGVSAKVIHVAMLGGDCYPATPIGINLPNAEWIREAYGSKSVTIENITAAYDKASKGSGFLTEFAYHESEIANAEKYGYLGSNLHTDLHECLGHGSGKMLEGVPVDALKNYHSTLEEARADLFALYYIMDPKLIEVGLIPSLEVGKTEYDNYIRNGLLTQLVRVELGKDLEESHMRNRQLIAQWAYEYGKENHVIEKVVKEGKSFFTIRDYEKLRELFGLLLKEVQRIKSEGDYNAGKALVEQYAVKIDKELHKEVLDRYQKLEIPPYAGFLNPQLKPRYENDQIIDIDIDYDEDYTSQMVRYSSEYSFLA
ncbi:dipeptidyl peptidase 3 [Halosquirtibacter xylanolyticus]|uniref:dipeptidyl-peptidase 3 family protein n=1 Tax=Halosquirtibacter xylanolyticus TaxID=3374599 RepID=UPI00374A9360|nr:dipeptidyl peptidase 3 [Prolixibacteraceae bacterium]